jgi:hypothetical protein
VAELGDAVAALGGTVAGLGCAVSSRAPVVAGLNGMFSLTLSPPSLCFVEDAGDPASLARM